MILIGRKLAMAKYLIGAGADVCIPAKNGCTVFDLVTFIGKFCLLSYSLDVFNKF